MVFSSMTFLFAFLPVVVLVYMLSPKQMKNAILLIASLFFYAWGEPRNILLMLLSIGINYVFGRIIEADRASQSKMRVWNLGFAVLWNVLVLGIFKYVSGISADTSYNAAVPHSSCKDCTSDWYFILYISGDFLSGRCVSRNDKGTE